MALLQPLLGAAGEDPRPRAARQTHRLTDPAWRSRLAQKRVEMLWRRPEVVFIGDSIFHRLESPDAAAAWATMTAGYRAINLGFGGDTTDNVLWRLERTLLDTPRPRLFVLTVGINNHGRYADPVAHMVAGVEAIVEMMRDKSAATPVLHMSVVPVSLPGSTPRTRMEALNDAIQDACDGDSRHWVDVTSLLVDGAGYHRPGHWSDDIHPSAAGYAAIAPAMAAAIAAATA